nr:protein EMSY-LIKE 3-like isoform X1 [Ipomoea batatas]
MSWSQSLRCFSLKLFLSASSKTCLILLSFDERFCISFSTPKAALSSCWNLSFMKLYRSSTTLLAMASAMAMLDSVPESLRERGYQGKIKVENCSNKYHMMTDIQLVSDGPRKSSKGSHNGKNQASSKKYVVRGGAAAGSGRGKGVQKSQIENNIIPTQNGIGKGSMGDIEILHTDTLLEQSKHVTREQNVVADS